MTPSEAITWTLNSLIKNSDLKIQCGEQIFRKEYKITTFYNEVGKRYYTDMFLSSLIIIYLSGKPTADTILHTPLKTYR